MKVKHLRQWLETIEDQDREIPIEIVIGAMDRETQERLMNFLSIAFLFGGNEMMQREALSLVIRLQIP